MIDFLGARLGFVYARVRHLDADLLKPGVFQRERGVNPAVGVQKLAGYVVFGDTIDGIAEILSGGHH